MENVITCDKGEYIIKDEMTVSDTTFFIAVDKHAKMPFLVGERRSSETMTTFKNLMITNSYVSALDNWNRRLAQAIADLKPQSTNQSVRT